MEVRYTHSYVFRMAYDNNKEYFKDLRPKLINYIDEDYEIACKLQVPYAEEYYKWLKWELKEPMSKTKSGIYMGDVVNAILDCDCFIDELEKYRAQREISPEVAVHDWIDKSFQIPAMEHLNRLLNGDELE